MRLWERRVKQRSNDDHAIDIHHIFYEKAPIIKWTREGEDT